MNVGVHFQYYQRSQEFFIHADSVGKKNSITLWCHQTWLAGKSLINGHVKSVSLGKSSKWMVNFPASHVWWHRRVNSRAYHHVLPYEEWSPYSYGPLQVISQLYNLMYRIITTFITIEIRGKSVNIRIIMHYKSHSAHISQLVKGHNSIFQWSFLRSFEVDIGCRHDFIAPRLCTVRPLLSWG